jgi:hypothetical protein
MWSIVHPLLNFQLAAIPSQHWCYARPTYQRIVVPIASPFLSKAAVPSPPICWRSLEALFGREMADNFAQRPPWGLRFFNVQ